jgi:hypothetical protein
VSAGWRIRRATFLKGLGVGTLIAAGIALLAAAALLAGTLAVAPAVVGVALVGLGLALRRRRVR